MKKMVLLLLLGIYTTNIVFTYEYDEVMELLAAEKGGNIEFLTKINLGIPGGENWIALREKSTDGGQTIKGWIYIYIYLIDSEKNVKRIDSNSIPKQSTIKDRHNNPLEFDVMENIPGTQIGNYAAAFGDYNGDGIDEIFIFIPWNDDYCVIEGYNSDKGKIETLLNCRYDISSIQGPPPVEFTNYQGIDGIKIIFWDYLDSLGVEGRYAWIFVAWDEGSKKYVGLADSENEEIYNSKFTPISPKADNEKDIDLPKVESIAIEEEVTAVLPEENNRNIRFTIIIGIISGIILLAVIAFIVIKKKRA